MRSTLIAAGAAACLVASFALYPTTRVAASTGPIPLNCDRACLEGIVNQYLAAVVAHDPKRLPLSDDVVYTENDQVLKVGDGFWKTAAGIGNYKHIFADPEFGQVAFMGTMQEAGSPLLLSLRLRIELGRITEIESVYFRTGGGGPNNIAGMDQAGKIEDMWFKSIPAGAAAVAPADDLDRRWLFHRSAEERRQGHPGYRHLSVHDTIAIASKTARPPPMCRGRPTSPPTPSTASPWTACRNSSWATTSSCRRSTAAAIRWSTASVASCGRTPCSIKGRSTRACCRMAGSTPSEASIGPRASWSPRRFSSRTARSGGSKWSARGCRII